MSCASCRYWERTDYRPRWLHPESIAGYCHRYAPRSYVPREHDTEHWPVWPLVLATEWCGDYRERRTTR